MLKKKWGSCSEERKQLLLVRLPTAPTIREAKYHSSLSDSFYEVLQVRAMKWKCYLNNMLISHKSSTDS